MGGGAGPLALTPLVLSLTLVLVVPAGSAPAGASSGALTPQLAAVGTPPTGAETVAPAYVPSPGVTDLGAVPESTSVAVDVGVASDNAAGLSAFVNASEVPGTPEYHQYLSPSAADARFGAFRASVSAAVGYFQGFGLAVDVHPDGLLLSVHGPGPAVARAFGTTLHVYRAPSGATFVDHPVPATLPRLAPWTGAFGLSTEAEFQPQLLAGSPETAATAATGCGSVVGALDPCQVATAYDFRGLDANGTNGSGRRIAVIDTYASSENQSTLAADLATFSRNYGLPPARVEFDYPVPSSVDLNGSGMNDNWALEDALDAEWAHAAAPGASIEVVFSPNEATGLYFAVDWVVGTGAADVLSMSWGEPEVGVFDPRIAPCSEACNASSDGSFAILEPVLELAASEGITAFAASGDCGSAAGTLGVSVDYPASSDFITGVGATNLTLTAGGAYAREVAWSGNSSGALSTGCLSNQGGSGGGFSVLPRPWWQAGEGTVPSRGRGVPDVAMVGGEGSPVVIVAEGSAYGVAGTSVGTPIWAGVAATADQVAGADLGWLNPGLYRLLEGAGYADDFHEVTSGWNGYTAHAGWNPLTGIGTPIVANLTGGLTGSTPLASNLSAFVYASPRFGPAPLTVRFAVAVDGGTGSFPVEGVSFGDGDASEVDAGGIAHTYLLAGVYSVQAYAIDSEGNTSASPAVTVVVGGGSGLAVGLTSSSASPAARGPVTLTATVRGGEGPYVYDFSFGDGSFADNLTVASVVHAYPVAGSFCAEVVAQDSATPPDGGASPRLSEAVGGAAASACGNPSQPLELRANVSEPVRDAPADFPRAFTTLGGSVAPDGLPPQLQLSSGDPYTAACACTILRSPGQYTLAEWENDTVSGEVAGTVNVTVAPPLRAAFSASTLAGDVPLSVTFSATASGGYRANATATHWTFGNGRGATGASVAATYTSPGEYVAVASLSDGGYGNASEAFVVDAEAPFSSALGLTATVTPAVNVSSGATVVWNATPVGPAPALAATIVGWQLGNGGSAFGRSANETYFAPADLPPADELAASVAVETNALIPLVRVPIRLPGFFAEEAGAFVPAASALGLDAVVTPATGLVPMLLTGVANATGPDGVRLDWAFGDSGIASGSTVAHVYYGPGRYTVRLEAADGFNDQAVRVVGVVAKTALTLVGCGSSGRHGTTPYSVHLAPTPAGGTGPPYTYVWDLPNGTVVTASNVSLTFDSAGTYEVYVTVSDPSNATYGCAWSIVVSTVPPDAVLEVLGGGVAVGAALTVTFLAVTRPRRPR